jgi:tetratricopeptide (TPR) repeat protein
MAIALVFLLLTAGSAGASAADSESAEYYFKNYDFPRSLELWKQVLKESPYDATATIRIAEISLMLEGRKRVSEIFEPAIKQAKDRGAKPLVVRLRSAFYDLQTRFLTDRGQNLFLQARLRKQHKDLSAARNLLDQASQLEPGHLTILSALAEVQLAQEDYKAYFSTLSESWSAFPLDANTRDTLVKAHFYFKDYTAALELLKASESLTTKETPLLRALALWETGQINAASTSMESVSIRANEPSPTLSLAYYLRGLLTSKRSSMSAESKRWLSKFLKYKPPQGFDPFRIAERQTEVQAMLQ